MSSSVRCCDRWNAARASSYGRSRRPRLAHEDSSLENLLNIAGAVALLLWAARMVRTGIERAFGPALRRNMARAVGGRGRAFASGLVVSLALQSATATALLAMGFVASGVMATAPALAAMLGADLGSALAVMVLSLDLSWLSPLLLLAGVILFMGSEVRRVRQIGRTFIGLGLLLLALSLIAHVGAQLQDSTALHTLIGALSDDRLLAFILAALITWAAHSSVATVLLLVSFVDAGVLPLPLALALVLGANVGAGIIPVVLAMPRARAEQRVPIGNLLFRAIGALFVLLVLPWISPWIVSVSTSGLNAVVAFHVGFNVLLAALFLPCTGVASRIVEWLVKERTVAAAPQTPLENPSYLDENAIGNPQLALTFATREVLRMAEWVQLMLRQSIDAFHSTEASTISSLEQMDDQVDQMHTEIKNYLMQVSRNPLDAQESQRCMEIVSFTVKMEHIGDIVEKNLLQLARKHSSTGRRFSAEGWAELEGLHSRVMDNLELALNVFVSSDVDTARQLIKEKDQFRDLEQECNLRHMQRLREGAAETIESSPIHLDVIRDLAQINSLLTSTAYPILEASGDLLRSRLRSTPQAKADSSASENVEGASRKGS